MEAAICGYQEWLGVNWGLPALAAHGRTLYPCEAVVARRGARDPTRGPRFPDVLHAHSSWAGAVLDRPGAAFRIQACQVHQGHGADCECQASWSGPPGSVRGIRNLGEPYLVLGRISTTVG